jgi:hypothetical protein
MIVIAIPTTPERTSRLANLISFIEKNSDTSYGVYFYPNLLGGIVPAMREMMKQLNPKQLVCVLGDDCEPAPNWLKILVETFESKFPDGDGLVQPNDGTGRNGGIASYPVCTAEYLLKWAYSGYTHNFCDEEMALTAKQRGKYAFVPTSIGNHRHHSNTPGVVRDETYKLEDESAFGDKELFGQRRDLSGNFTHREVLAYD